MRFLLLIALAGGCVSARTRDNLLGVAMFTSNVIITCDVHQTMWASNDGRWDRIEPDGMHAVRELNPLLGQTPSIGTLTGVWAADIVVNSAVHLSTRIPTWVRVTWAVTVLAFETRALVYNSRDVPGVCGMQ